MLAEELRNSPGLGLFHMACQVDEELHQVVFFYKLMRGASEKSHGMNVASMAGVPKEVGSPF